MLIDNECVCECDVGLSTRDKLRLISLQLAEYEAKYTELDTRKDSIVASSLSDLWKSSKKLYCKYALYYRMRSDK